mmetsp:Transcript_7586/g.18475  ORF Transcript_7586/g.18475 Transcript_7586/m.18475 type:complete len:224 (+) Transcript_7586:511-1182(+)
MMQIFVKTVGDRTLTLDVEGSMTLRALKQMIEDLEGVNACDQCLVVAGKLLCDECTVSECVQNESTVHLALSVRGGSDEDDDDDDDEGDAEEAKKEEGKKEEAKEKEPAKLFEDDVERQELVVMYCGLILNDAGIEINEENINKLVSASKNEVAPYWPKMFAEIVKGKDFNKIVEDAAGSPGAGGAVAGGAAGGDAAGGEAKKEEKKEEEEDDGGFDFSDDDE